MSIWNRLKHKSVARAASPARKVERKVKARQKHWYDVDTFHDSIANRQINDSARLKETGRKLGKVVGGGAKKTVLSEVLASLYDPTVPKVADGQDQGVIQEVFRALESDMRFKRLQRHCNGSPRLASALTNSLLDPIITALDRVQDKDEPTPEEIDDIRRGTRAGIEEAKETQEKYQGFRLSFGIDGETSKQDKDDADKLLEYLDDYQLAAIMKLAGKVVPLAAQKAQQLVTKGIGEITRLHTSDEVKDAVHSELALLANDRYRAVALKRIAEKELVTWEREQRDDAGNGPVVFLCDKSASMRGTRLAFAKALLLGLARFAAVQGRPFGIVWFNSSAEKGTLYPAGTRPTELLPHLRVNAGGGTDFTDAFDAGLDMIRNNASLKGADIICLTDGESYIDADRLRAELEELSVNALGIEVQKGYGESALEYVCDSVVQIDELTVESTETIFDKLAEAQAQRTNEEQQNNG